MAQTKPRAALPPVSLPALLVGQTARNGVLTFNEAVPTDGAVTSSDPTICPISLAADGITWTAGPALAVGTCTFSYTGTSASNVTPPDVSGPVQIADMICTVNAQPVAEQGSFNPGSATIS